MPIYQRNHPYSEPNKAKARERDKVGLIRRVTVTRESTELTWDVFLDKSRNMYEMIEEELRLRHGCTLGSWQTLDDYQIFRDMFFSSQKNLDAFDKDYKTYFADKHRDPRLQATRNNFYEILFTETSGYKIDLSSYIV